MWFHERGAESAVLETAYLGLSMGGRPSFVSSLTDWPTTHPAQRG